MTGEPDTDATQQAVQENYEVLKRARDQLQRALGQDAEGNERGWLRQVQAGVRALSAALEQHQRLAEDDDGTLHALTEQKPSLLTATQRLEREHTEMLLRATEIDEDVDRQFAFEEYMIDLVRLEAAVLHDMFHLHIVRSDSLAYEAYFREEGGESG